jgi:glycosyltransferase involved in cell wall biosynthesis
MPCLNEEETVGECVSAAAEALRNIGVEGEVIVVDNGCTDASPEVARKNGARVVREPKRGYGNAYLRGFKEASGDIIVMGDADGTYPFELIPDFIKPIMEGEADLVMGSRLKGNILPGAMSRLHRYLGNPLLTSFLNMLFKTRITDAHCGMRAFRKEALEKLNLKTPGMEFASEMIIKAAKAKVRIKEIPITYRPRRGGKAKLSSLKDGWRHLRFMLLYKPAWLFFLPGTASFVIGFAMMMLLTARFHSMILGGLLMILGFQIITLGLYAKIYAVTHHMDEADRITRFFLRYNSLEYEMFIGILLFLGATTIGLRVLIAWIQAGFGTLFEIRNAILASTFAIIGLQMIFAAMFLSVLLLEKKED